MFWIIGLFIYLALLASVRHVLSRRWLDGRMTTTQVSVVVGAVWALFPFLGIAVGAAWSLPVAAFVAALLFVSVLVSTYGLLSSWGRRSGVKREN